MDLVIFTIREQRLHVLLIERAVPPFAGRWALPGGFIREGETLEHAALRELQESISSSSSPSGTPGATRAAGS